MEHHPIWKGHTASVDEPATGAVWPPATITSAAAARRYVRSVVGERWRSASGQVTEEAMIDLLLVVSELVTNALRHGGGIAGFVVAPTPVGVRLSVRDHNDALPVTAHAPGVLPCPHEAGGYGWPLIVRLSREVGVERRPGGGKTISVLVPLT